MDFYTIRQRTTRSETEIYPDFCVGHVKDLLVRGKSFYAVWNEEKGLWSTNILDVPALVDHDLWEYAEKFKREGYAGPTINVKTLASFSSGSWLKFMNMINKYGDTSHQLDEKLTFQNTEVKKEDYVSKRLPYALEPGDYSAWDKLVGQLYSPEERQKIEWAIGAVVSGDSRKIQKFFVFYGDPGTGKGTIIDIIMKLFDGYFTVFDAKGLGMSSNQFSTEVFRSNPLVAIQHDGDLSRIEDNTRLNSIISHEDMVINEKGKAQYTARMNCFLFIGTNRPVKITDAKSGIIRRLIDISPTGKKFSPREYESLMNQIEFQLGAIAYHCLEVYRDLGKNYYKNYSSQGMIEKTDVFFNFVEANRELFESQEEGIGLKQAYTAYKEYCENSYMEYKLPMYRFREELKNYFERFERVARIDGKQVRSWYVGFKKEKLDPPVLLKEEHCLPMVLDDDKSTLDDILADCPAQYAVDDGSGNEKPEQIWEKVTTKLRDLDTRKVHYVRIPKNHIVIDFDIKNDKGEKDMLLNLEAASKWPRTYAEFSKGGCGLHLHYIYDGDVDKLNPLYDEGIEIKVFRGKSALRRRLSKCMNAAIATLGVGALPMKEEKMIDIVQLKDEKHLRNIIKKCLRKENHGATRPEIDLIAKVLDDAHQSGMVYDVSDLEHDILVFAMGSTHQSDYCVRKIGEMVFRNGDVEEASTKKEVGREGTDISEGSDGEPPIVFYDVEVFPNLFLVNWKVAGEGNKVVRMINPKGQDIEKLFKFRLVGFNCRKYDNHILYARYLGYSNADLYDLSQRIIVEGARDAFFPEAYNISYTDIYDFSAKKQSLKKWEIELGIHHQELGLPWDKPVPEELWDKVAEYCDNDVIATEAVWNHLQEDWIARQILADIAGGRPNDTTNQLTTKIIFGSDRNPKLVYTDLATGEQSLTGSGVTRKSDIPNSFPGYEYTFGEKDKKPRNMYRGVDLGFGGYVHSEPGIYTDVALLDISSMHPNSAVNLNYFGEYTGHFKDLLDARIAIKNGDYERVRSMFDGKLGRYLTDSTGSDQLAGALKIAINAVYGLTSASFDNPFRDKRNKNNIVALRGALFMKTLQDEVVAQGFKVVHIKTDSIKIPNATPDIIRFCMDFAKMYGYTFEHEATYDRMCLIDKAQYIAAYKDPEACKEMYGYSPKDNVKHFKKHDHPWTATGAQFQHPYVFKTVFSGEGVDFADRCETKNVTGGAIYLDLNENLPDVADAEKEMERRADNEKHPEKPKRLNKKFADYDDEELALYISKGHDYRFIGRVGLFCPIRPGCGGGLMVCDRNGKYNSVNGTKDYRWLEAEMVRQIHKENELDPRYFDNLVEESIKAIDLFGDFDDFVDTTKPYVSKIPELYPPDDELPFELVPCGDGKYNTCMDCPNCVGDVCKRGYSLLSYIEKGGDGV